MADIENKIERFIDKYFQDNNGERPEEISVTAREYRAILASTSSDGGISSKTGDHCLMFCGIPIKVKPYSDLEQDWEIEAEQDEAWEEFHETTEKME